MEASPDKAVGNDKEDRWGYFFTHTLDSDSPASFNSESFDKLRVITRRTAQGKLLSVFWITEFFEMLLIWGALNHLGFTANKYALAEIILLWKMANIKS